MKRIDLILLALVLALLIVPLLLPLAPHDGLFSGADGQAEALISTLHPDYEPWFSGLWEPPSGEIESLLFALQAALGAGLVGYYFGLRRGQRREQDRPRARH